MLEQLKLIADKLAFCRTPSLLLSFVTLIVLVWLVLRSQSQAQDIFLIPTLLMFIWLLLLYSFLSLFAQIPHPPDPGARRQERFLAGIKRAFYYLFALSLLLVTNALIVTSLQLLGAWARMY